MGRKQCQIPNQKKKLFPFFEVFRACFSENLPGEAIDKLVFLGILLHADKFTGEARPSQKRLAKVCGLSERTVRNSLKRLKSNGAFEYFSNHRHVTVYLLRLELLKPSLTGTDCRPVENFVLPADIAPLPANPALLPANNVPLTGTDCRPSAFRTVLELPLDLDPPNGGDLARGSNMEKTRIRTDDQTSLPTTEEIASEIKVKGRFLADRVGDENISRDANHIADNWLKEPLASKTAKNLKNLAIRVGLTPEEVGFPDVKQLHLARSLDKVSKKPRTV